MIDESGSYICKTDIRFTDVSLLKLIEGSDIINLVGFENEHDIYCCFIDHILECSECRNKYNELRNLIYRVGEAVKAIE